MGHYQADAARRFQVGIASAYRWLGAEDGLAYRRPGPRGPRRLDWAALAAQVENAPDWTLSERARHFGVSRNGIGYALQRLGMSRKKNARLSRARSAKAASLRALAGSGATAGENARPRRRKQL
ncbi:MAG: transposase [Candidatus Competibacteraceae bacterium]|nr:transposase [Candidatus Competibacteraceae bacterium]